MSRPARPSGRKAVRGHGELLAALIVLALTAFTYSSVPEAHPDSALAAGSVLYVPAAAHATGANGSNWRTDMEVHNPGSSTASFTVQLLMREANNSNPASHSYTLAAQQSRRFRDVLDSEFHVTGAAALRVTITSGSLVVTARTYNLIGVNPWNLPQGSSFGQYERAWDESLTIGYGQEGRLIQLTQQPASSLDGFRTNVGIVNTSAIPIDVRIDCYRSDGTWLGKKDGGETSLPPYGFRQLNEMLGAWGIVSDGYAIVKTTTPGGRLLAFASVNDNHNSGDPIFVPAAVMTSSGPAPTPTATATLTPTLMPTTPPASRPNLFLYQPSGWGNCFSLNYQSGCCDGSSCCSPFLSSYYDAFIQFFVANSGSATLTGPVRFALSIDGAIVGYATWDNDTGLEPNYGAILTVDYSGNVSPGTHTVTLTIDPDNAIAESNEGDNSCTRSATWTSIVFGRSKPAIQGVPEVRLAGGAVVPLAGATAREPLSVSSASVYVAASAHNSGQNGSNWRTDLEVHNPGSTAITFTVDLLMQSTDNGGSVPTRTFSLGPQQSVRYVDILASVFGVTGAAAIRVTPLSGSALVTSRTYNLIGANSVGLPVGASFGQFVPGLPASEATGYGEEARLIQLTHRAASSMTDFRSNVGILNTTGSAIDLRLDLFTAGGSLLGTVQDSRTHLRPYESVQLNTIFGSFTSWLDDGYVVARTTTPGGRFFAFASVNDNHVSGDPIFIPAVKTAGSTPPPTPSPTPTQPTGPSPTPTRTVIATPTPTRTATPTLTPTPTQPVAGTPTISGIEILNGAMQGLGKSGSGTLNVADIANTAKNNGLDAALTQIANASPQRITKSGNGLVVNYGSSYRAKDGSIYQGSVTIATSSFTVSGSHVTWRGVVTPNGITRDGRPLGTGTGNVTIDYTANGSTVVGDVSGTVTSTSNPGSSASGNVHVDTSVCPKYPISGSLTATQAGKTSTATFTTACDGSYVLSGAALNSSGFELSIKKCDGTYRTDYPYFKVALVESGGSIVKDPACGNKAILGFYNVRAWGTTTNTSVKLYFSFNIGGGGTGMALHNYAGVFQGTRSAPGAPILNGTATYTVAVPQNSCTNAFTQGAGGVSLVPKASGCSY